MEVGEVFLALPDSCHLVGWFLLLILLYLVHSAACGCLWSCNWRGLYS